MAIRVEQLTKEYPGGAIAVDGVDLEIADGEFFVVLGPSGCGKSTLLRMIAGLEEITSGDILVDGRSVRHLVTSRRGMGMLFQQSALYPHLTVRENLAFPLMLGKVHRSEIRRRVAEIAAIVGLGDVLDLRPAQLSGGMRQRVALGRALVREPSLLLMDEPMSNLDAKLRTELRGELAALRDTLGATTVYVTHDQVEAMALGDRAAVMRAGTVVQCAPPVDLYRYPVDLFVASFVGSPPINLVLGTLVERDDGWRLRIGPNDLALGTGERWTDLRRWEGRELAVGIRPEALALVDGPTERSLTVEISGVEDLGAHDLVSATLAACAVSPEPDRGSLDDCLPMTTITALSRDRVDVDLWKPVHLDVDVEAIHLFDLESGRALPLVVQPASTAVG